MATSERIVNIQLLRGIAALLVVAEHTKNAVATAYFRADIGAGALSALPFGFRVDIFFVISGFVMAHSSERLHSTPGAWRCFLWRRVVLIAPLYWVTTGLLIAFFIVTRDAQWQNASWNAIVSSFLFIPAANGAGAPLPLYPVGWTLNHEMFFYLVFATFIGLPGRRAVTAVAVTMLALVAFGIIVDPSEPILDVWSASIMIEFVLGMGLYELHRVGLARLPVGVAVAAGVVAGAVVVVRLSDPGTDRALMWGGPAALIVLVALSLPSAPRRISNFLGNISYAAYLVHTLIILALAPVFRRWLPSSDVVWFVLFPSAVFFATLAGASIAHYFFERPVMIMLQRDRRSRFSSGDRPGPIGAAPAG